MPKPAPSAPGTPLPVHLLPILAVAALLIAGYQLNAYFEAQRIAIAELYVEKGETLIRLMDLGHRHGWHAAPDELELRAYQAANQSQGVLWMAVTTADGTLDATSVPADTLDRAYFANPAPIDGFHPRWISRHREFEIPEGPNAFVVYRPLLSTLEADAPSASGAVSVAKPAAEAEPEAAAEPGAETGAETVAETGAETDAEAESDAEPEIASPLWPPRLDVAGARERARYLWVAFDGDALEVFDAARDASRPTYAIMSVIVLVAIGYLYHRARRPAPAAGVGG